MNLANVSIPLAVAAGATSFLSPCVLPLVPSYMGFLAQSATGGGGAASPLGRNRARVMLGSLGFVLGLSLFLVAFFYALYRLLEPWKHLALPIMGAVVILLGLSFMGVFRQPWLSREARWLPVGFTRGGFPAGLLLGLGFAAGWTPCIGPVLGAVLTSGIEQGTTGRGLLLIAAYCLGLGSPFILVALLIDRATPALRVLNRHQRAISLVGGALVVAMGVLVISDNVPLVYGWFSTHLPTFFKDPFDL
ncbi:MAG TPA: cytochrome c biogenesis protein CcdA [Candidatus Dormibacteraeota bacterium]|nr:cytochrome c biogenesis protein CcdA [Candidatus Dormibacteraeota bacterium]